MATKRATSGEIIDLVAPGDASTRALVKTDDLEVLRLAVERGKTIDTHQVPGDLTVQCLEGRAALTLPDREIELRAGQLVYLEGDTPHGVRGIEDARLLATIHLRRKGRA